MERNVPWLGHIRRIQVYVRVSGSQPDRGIDPHFAQVQTTQMREYAFPLWTGRATGYSVPKSSTSTIHGNVDTDSIHSRHNLLGRKLAVIVVAAFHMRM